MHPFLSIPRPEFEPAVTKPLVAPVVFEFGRHLRRMAATRSGRRAARRAMRQGPRAVERLVRGRELAMAEFIAPVDASECKLVRRSAYSTETAGAIVRSWADLGIVDAEMVRRVRANDPSCSLDSAVLKEWFGRFQDGFDRAEAAINGIGGAPMRAGGLLDGLYLSVDAEGCLLEMPDLFDGLPDQHWLFRLGDADAFHLIASVFELISGPDYFSPLRLYDFFLDHLDCAMVYEGVSDKLIELVQVFEGDYQKLHAELTNRPETLPLDDIPVDELVEILEFTQVDTPRSLRFAGRDNGIPMLGADAILGGLPDSAVPKSLKVWAQRVIKADQEVTKVLKAAANSAWYPPVEFETAEDSAWGFGGFCLGAFPFIDWTMTNEHFQSLMQSGFFYRLQAPCPTILLCLGAQVKLIEFAHRELIALQADCPCGS